MIHARPENLITVCATRVLREHGVGYLRLGTDWRIDDDSIWLGIVMPSGVYSAPIDRLTLRSADDVMDYIEHKFCNLLIEYTGCDLELIERPDAEIE